jgi:hypothetical protein
LGVAEPPARAKQFKKKKISLAGGSATPLLLLLLLFNIFLKVFNTFILFFKILFFQFFNFLLLKLFIFCFIIFFTLQHVSTHESRHRDNR